MRSSKLYSILVKFDRYRQNRLRKFLMSPYFNRSEQLVQLFELHVELVNESEKAVPSKREFWDSMNSTEEFNDVRFRKYVSDLLKLVERYLIQERLDADGVRKQKYLVDAVLDEKLDRLYTATFRAFDRAIENQPFRSSEYFFDRYVYQAKCYELVEVKQDRKEKRPVEEVLKNINSFSLCEQYRYTCQALSHQVIYNHGYDLPKLPEPDHTYESPALQVYAQMYRTQIDYHNVKHYYKLRDLLQSHGQIFPIKEAEFIYFSALNYCIRKNNAGRTEFKKELLELYKDLLNKNILTASGPISPWHFRNITTIALRNGEFDWTENFIREFSSKLPTRFQKNAVSFNTAQLHMHKKNFEKVVEILSQIEYDDITYNLNSKTMLVATYFELNEMEPLYSLFDSFRTYLNRHKDIASSRRTNYTNLIKLTKKLTNTPINNFNKLQALMQEVDNLSKIGIASESWLREKIAERLAKAK